MDHETAKKLNAAFWTASHDIAQLAGVGGSFPLCVRDLMHEHLDAAIKELDHKNQPAEQTMIKPDDYHRQWFSDFFSRIDEREFGTTNDEARTAGRIKSCLGHLRPPVVTLDRQYIVRDFTRRYPTAIEINDGFDPRFQQPTAKARILAALQTQWLY